MKKMYEVSFEVRTPLRVMVLAEGFKDAEEKAMKELAATNVDRAMVYCIQQKEHDLD